MGRTKNLMVLNETTLNRITKGHEKDGYVIISACRSLGNSATATQYNNVNTNDLRSTLRKKGYSYLAVYGGYHEDGAEKPSIEKSFVVYPYDIYLGKYHDWDKFYANMIEIGKSYNQDSILVCPPGGSPRYVYLDTMKEGDPFNDIKYNDVTQKYFTALKKWYDTSLNRKGHDWQNGNPQRYTMFDGAIEECYDAEEDSNFVLYVDAFPVSMSGSMANCQRRDMQCVCLNNDDWSKLKEQVYYRTFDSDLFD